MAEVTLNLVAAEREYAIKRRIFRDGTNEYYINGDQVRLKDIQDFFLGTGIGLHSYAIVEQGNIEHLAQMKPQERRVVIEETSGITRFEEKKRDAFGRLEEVRVNLDRVEDILSEVTRNCARSEEEWQRLKEYQALKERLDGIDVHLLVEGLRKLEKREEKLGERETELAQDVETKDAEIRGAREAIGAKDEELSLTDALTRDIELDIATKEKDIESRVLEITYIEDEKKRLSSLKGELANTRTEIAGRLEAERTEEKADAERTAKEISLLGKEEEDYGVLQQQKEELKTSLDEFEWRMEEERSRLFATASALADVNNRAVEAERLIKERKAREERRLEEERRLTGELKLLEEKLTGLKGRLEKENVERERCLGEEEGLTEALDRVAAEIAERRGRIERLKGEKRGKEEFLKQMKSTREPPRGEDLPYAHLVDILKVPKEAENAVDRLFAKEMGYQVLTVSGDELASIVEKNARNFIFFSPKGIFSNESGEVEMSLHRVEHPKEAFERIEKGEEGIFAGEDFAIDSRGFILRERETRGISLKEFRERKRVEKELVEIQGTLDAEQAALPGDQKRMAETEQVLQALRVRKKDVDGRLAGIERERIVVETQTKTAQERLGELASRYAVEEEAPPVSMQELAGERERLEQEKALGEERVKKLRDERDSFKAVFEEMEGRFHELTIHLERKRAVIRRLQDDTERRRIAIERMEQETAQLVVKIETADRELAEVATKIATLEESHGQLAETLKKQVTRYEDVKRSLGELHAARAALQEGLDVLHQEMEKIRARREGLEKEKAVLEERKETVRERLRTEFSIEDVASVAREKGFSEGDRQAVVAEMERIGEVNFRSEKEYHELKDRFEFLTKQKADLEQAVDSLKKTIAKLDSVSRDLFVETFDMVNDAFKRFSHALFKGGKGELVYNRDTMGVDLYITPPGKKVTRMELLSGGEKALISLAFLLSLMETKASPFTLMDEIDAPLDDANLMSLLDIIRSISKKTQVVLITHNRLTMEASDTVYGITMEEDGVSKTISIKL
jgi:chromosome segregation protein